MTNDKGKPRDGRILYQAEIFKDGPATDKGNLSTTIGAEQGIEFFGGQTGHQRRQRLNNRGRIHVSPTTPSNARSSAEAGRCRR